jgi:hypothetical protein
VAGGSAMAGLDTAPDSADGSHSEPPAEKAPPGGAATGEREVLDLTGDDSEEEDVAATKEAVMETVEERDPERSTARPDEAVPEAGEKDVSPEEALRATPTTSGLPVAAVGLVAPDATAQASDAADVPVLPLGGVPVLDQSEVAAQVPGGSAPPATSLGERTAAEDAEKDVPPAGVSQAPGGLSK